MRELGLAGNAVEDLGALSDLAGLRRLDLRGDAVWDLRPLRALPSLVLVHVRGSRIEDLAPVDGLAGLTVAEGDDREPPAALGRCAGPCKEPWDGGPDDRYCPGCKERRRQQRKRVRGRRIEAGLCTECGMRPPLPGLRYCGRCQAKACRASKRRYYRRKRERRCASCGRKADLGSRTTCKRCRALKSGPRQLTLSNGRLEDHA